MAQRYYYLEPNRNYPEFATLHEFSSISKSSDGRYVPVNPTSTYIHMVSPYNINKSDPYGKSSFSSGKYAVTYTLSYPEVVDDVKALDIKPKHPFAGAVANYTDAFIQAVDVSFCYIKFGKNEPLRIFIHNAGKYVAHVKEYNKDNKIVLYDIEGTSTKVTVGDRTVKKSKFDKKLIGTTSITVELICSQRVLAKYGEYDIGADWRSDGTYCFYCSKDIKNLQYLDNPMYPFPTIKDHDILQKNHNHEGIVRASNTTGSSNSSSSSKAIYSSSSGKPISSTPGNAVTSLSGEGFGTVGEYLDGIATVPFVMLELRASEDAEVGYNVSLPTTDGKGMNSIISLSHERHMQDSYNTFSLQVFDKDAMDIEAKLLLGFRYITFYYTDFVATSKRFKGMILNYKTTITGKGLMLTLEGYTTNVKVYIGKDSIPWSILCDVNDIEFLYWMNEAKEYHGEVRYTIDKDGKARYNSTEGIYCTQKMLKDDNVDMNRVSYSLKVPKDKESESDLGYKWQTYDEYYNGISSSVRSKYRPTIHKWSLNDYVKFDLNNQIDNILTGEDQLNLKKKRPSDIVGLICMINGWKAKITPTRSVSEIPDQLSMSYIEYIKEKLIPISVSAGEKSKTGYYFWFDDEGVANYAPYNANTENVKKLYFNSVEHKDSYPLIGFTSATNGSVLMVSDATNVMEAINPYTGDALSLTSVSGIIDDESYLSLAHETSEWYSTNRIIVENSSDDEGLKQVSYSNVSSLPSEEELKNKLINRYGVVSRYSFKASLDVYGCADISPGDPIDIYIYTDDGARSDDPTSTEITEERTKYNDEDVRNNKIPMSEYRTETYEEVVGYKGNITMHHSSGRYMVTKITDSVSAGKYISSLEVYKVSEDKLLRTLSFVQSKEGSNESSDEQIIID